MADEFSSLVLHDLVPIGPFDYRWPAELEKFERGWAAVVDIGGRRRNVRHGLGSYIVFGKARVHGVTWIDDQPIVEGVAADDYDQSRALLSRIKRLDKKAAKTDDEVPASYKGFMVVDHRAEIKGPYSPHLRAVKIVEDDVTRWVAHALIRLGLLGAGELPPSNPQPAPAPPAPVSTHRRNVDRLKVVEALLSYGKSLALTHTSGIPPFTPNADANHLVKDDPFAFLVAVICDQGIQAERAWCVPSELKKRLGHLDPKKIADDPDAVATAFRADPALVRYVNKVPAWVVKAAEQVLHEYRGDAGQIWDDQPEAQELQRRLVQFTGIGQKKAAMAVEILARDLDKPIHSLEGSDIAYDVHLRRVFLRTGLAESDDEAHMIQEASDLHPERPGELDLPCWMIGRQWCRPKKPKCGTCVLSEACPRWIDRAASVKGG